MRPINQITPQTIQVGSNKCEDTRSRSTETEYDLDGVMDKDMPCLTDSVYQRNMENGQLGYRPACDKGCLRDVRHCRALEATKEGLEIPDNHNL